MKIDNDFTVSAPIDRAWEILNDIPTIAPCMPGAVLTNSDGDTHEGKVKVKVGPITSEYKGKAVFIEKDEANHKLVIKGEGRDTRGAGNANADITLTMKPNGDRTDVTVNTDLKITGKVAQFGRGVIVDISQKLLGQFVDCLEQKISTMEEDAGRIAGASAEVAAGGAAAAAGAGAAMGIGKTPSGDVDVSGEPTATECFPGGPDEAAAVAGGIADKIPGVSGAATAMGDKISGVSGAGDVASGLADKAGNLTGGLADKAGSIGGAGVAGAAAAAAGAGALAGGAAGKLTGAAGKAGSIAGGGDAEEPEALDLMDIAGGAVYKRLIPVAIVGILILAIIIWLIVR